MNDYFWQFNVVTNTTGTSFIQIGSAKKITFEGVEYNWHLWVLGAEQILTLFWAAW